MSKYFRREKSLVPLKLIHNLEDAHGRCMSVSHVLIRILGDWWGNECPTEFHDIKEDNQPKCVLAFSRQMALHFLQITVHTWLLVHATTRHLWNSNTQLIRRHHGCLGTKQVMVTLGGKGKQILYSPESSPEGGNANLRTQESPG